MMDNSVEIHAPEEVLQLPAKRKSDGSSKSKRAKTATSSGSKATEVEQSAGRPSRSREPKKSVAASVSVVGQPSSDGSEHHRSWSGDHKRRSHGSDRRQDSPRHHSSTYDSGRREGERAQPTSSDGSSSRRQADSTGGLGLSRVSLRATDVRPSGSSSHSYHHHHKSSGDRRSLFSSSSRASADRKSPPGHHQDGRHESAERSGSSYVSRREVQLSPAITQSLERRTVTVIPSPTQPEHVEESAAEVDDPARVTGLTVLWTGQQVTAQQVTARQMTTRQVTAQQMTAQHMMGQQVTGQQGDPSWSWMTSLTSWMIQRKLPTQQVNSHEGMAQQLMMTTRQVWPAQHTIRTWQWTAQQLWMVRWPMILQQGTRQLQDRTHPCCRMLAVFCSHHCQERSTRLLWLILCPCGLWCSVGWTRVWLFLMPRPGPLHSQPFLCPKMMTPHPGGPRLHAPRTPDRWPRMPVRWSRTPVRRTRGLDDTRESTCSRSPIRRSSSSDSPPRDASPVNFSAALDSEDKVKDRSITDDEDEDGAQKKVSAAQYQLLWQAVTTSKGSFKVNPAKSRRASRASLLELGDSEVTDRVSWLDQPSLKDTMASTAHIAQGLKEDEEVEKTLSETSSSTFKHLTVKQIFPREPYRLKVHRDAQYIPKPPGDSGVSDSKASSSYQISHRVCLHTEELARRSAIYASLADSRVASVICHQELSPKDERTKLLRQKLAIIQEAQVSAVSAGFAAASNLQLLRRDALLKNFGFQLRSCLQWELHHPRAPMC